MEEIKKVSDLISELGDALDDGKTLSYRDFKLIDQLKDRLIMCAALLAARGRGRMTTAERNTLNALREAADQVIEINED